MPLESVPPPISKAPSQESLLPPVLLCIRILVYTFSLFHYMYDSPMTF